VGKAVLAVPVIRLLSSRAPGIFRWLLKREIARLFAALFSSHGLPACDVRSAVRGQASDFLKE
jgi:hypothetical protein